MIVLSITPRRKLVASVRFSTRSSVTAHGMKDLFPAAWRNGLVSARRTLVLSCVLSYTISARCQLSTPPVYNLLSIRVSDWTNMRIAKSNIISPPFSTHGSNGLSWRVDLGLENLRIAWLKLLPSFRSWMLRIREHTGRKSFNVGAFSLSLRRMLRQVSISSRSPKKALRHSQWTRMFLQLWPLTILSFIWIW